MYTCQRYGSVSSAFATMVLLAASFVPLSVAAEMPKVQEKARTDVFGDPLPEGALVRMGTIRFRSGFWVSSVAFSPDGKAIAYGSRHDNHDVYLADVQTRRPLRTFRLKAEDLLQALAFSKDGKMLAAGVSHRSHVGDGAIIMWEVATGKERWRQVMPQGVACLAFSPNGKELATSGTEMHFWKPENGKLLRRFKGIGSIGKFAYSPDGRMLATRERDKLIMSLWETATWRERLRFESKPSTAADIMAFSPDGHLLVGTTLLGDVHYWDPRTGKDLGAFELERGSVCGLTFSPDGKTLAVARDYPAPCLMLWDVATRKQIRTLEGHNGGYRYGAGFGSVDAVAFSPAEVGSAPLLASGGTDHTLRLWDPQTGKQQSDDHAHTGPIETVFLGEDGQVLTVSHGERAYRLWNGKNGKELKVVALGDKRVGSAVVSPNGVFLAVAHQGGPSVIDPFEKVVRLFDVKAGKEIKQWTGKTGVRPLAFTPDSRSLIACEGDRDLLLWDCVTDKVLCRFHLEKSPWGQPAVAPDGKTLAVRVLDNSTGVRLIYLAVLDILSGKECWSVKTVGTDPLAFSPDGKTLAEGTSGGVQLWDTANGTKGKDLPGDMAQSIRPTQLAFTPDGKTLIASTDDRRVFLWDMPSGKQVRNFVAHRGSVNSVSISPDGKTFATAGDDTTALIWELKER